MLWFFCEAKSLFIKILFDKFNKSKFNRLNHSRRKTIVRLVGGQQFAIQNMNLNNLHYGRPKINIFSGDTFVEVNIFDRLEVVNAIQNIRKKVHIIKPERNGNCDAISILAFQVSHLLNKKNVEKKNFFTISALIELSC